MAGGIDSAQVELAAAVKHGQRKAIAEALNLLDNHSAAARAQATLLLDALLPDDLPDGGHLIGVTGPPGAGKSTLCAALIRHWRSHSLRVGVLAVDPSSSISGGALLGDRLRLQIDPKDDGVFVRSLSSRGEFGGLAAEIWPMCLLLLATFDIVLVETVGVGQREADVFQLCDTTLFVVQPGAGDSVQFIKAGVMELPHVFAVNKSDLGELAQRTLSALEGALPGNHPDGHWKVPVVSTSATTGEGVETLVAQLKAHQTALLATNVTPTHRRRAQGHWLVKRLREEFGQRGIERLGGDRALLDLVSSQSVNPLAQYADLRQQCTRS
ncbi:MAG: methylmalonyl Co-A mutase-associated GTPase MeaB [Pseudomonadota bacterium]